MRWPSVALAAAALALPAGCGPSRPPPGMAVTTARPHAEDPTLLELARAEAAHEERALLIVHPRSACSGSASMVFVDDRGAFVAAVPPGSAALVRVPRSTERLRYFSSVEVTAVKGTWYLAADVAVPPFPAGLLLRAQRFTPLLCGSGHYATAVPALKEELESALAEQATTWLVPDPSEGQAWLDAHRARVAELRGRPTHDEPPWSVPLHARR